MFSESYIEKCVKYREDIDHLIGRARGKEVMPIVLFRVGDAFHNPTQMAPDESKIVTKVEEGGLYAEDPNMSYRAENCILVPTEQQLKEGLEASHVNLGRDVYGNGPEYLLDEYIGALEEKRERKRKNESKA